MPKPLLLLLLLVVPASSSAWVSAEAEGDDAPKLTLGSTAFKHGQPIPAKYTVDGDDVSPPLHWSHLPAGTKQLALIVEDPDAPTREPWVHWVIYRIPADASGLAEHRPRTATLEEPKDARQGRNTWGDLGYRGPRPPAGDPPHRYVFRLYALDAELDLQPGATKHTLVKAMEGRILATAELHGTYQRE